MGKNFTSITRLLCCLCITLCIASVSKGQTMGGPDLYGYIWRDNNDANGPAYSWVDLVNTPGAIQVAGLEDDNIKGPFAIGFPFHFYWYDVTTFRIGSNGYVGFTGTSRAHPFPIIPTPGAIENYIAVMMSDLTFTDINTAPIPGAECWYWTNPTNDSLVVSYVNVPFWDPVAPGHFTGSNTFQVVFSGADSSVTINIQSQVGIYSNPLDFCTIGIENNSGSIGLMHSHDVFPPSVYSIKFYPPASSTFQVNDASTTFNNNPTTGALFLSKDGSPFIMNTQVSNTGNQPLASFNVFSRIFNPLNQVQATGTLPTSALNPGQSEDLFFTAPFLPTVAGTYRYISDTQLLGDVTPSNNQKVMELQVVDTTAASILLSYDNGIEAGLGGLGWQGGGGGAAIEIVPPFYPCNITQLRAFIAANVNLTGFSMLLLDDDGPNGGPLTVLDSVSVDPANVLVGAWNFVNTTTPITIDSGSFYVAWLMGADGISIGQNQVPPFSNRTYEILGQASNPNSWAIYRSRELEDLMINAYISSVPVGIAENENLSLGNFYPNPANNITSIDYNFPVKANSLTWIIYDITGKQVLAGNEGSNHSSGTIVLNTASLNSGIYNCTISNGNTIFNRKLTLIK